MVYCFRCDSRCHYFGECCFDAEKSKSFLDQPSTDILKYECVRFHPEEDRVGYAVVSECPPNSDLELVNLCQAGVGGSWSPLRWPVYDQKTKLRYEMLVQTSYLFSIR